VKLAVLAAWDPGTGCEVDIMHQLRSRGEFAGGPPARPSTRRPYLFYLSAEHGRSFCGDFFPWYNTEHHHVVLGLFTPHDVHYGLAAAKGKQRARLLAEAFGRHPERFPNGRPSPKPLPTAVWINPPKVPAVAGSMPLMRRVAGVHHMTAGVTMLQIVSQTASGLRNEH